MTKHLIPTILLLLALALIPTVLARAQAPDRFLITLDMPSKWERTALLQEGFEVWGATTDSITVVGDRATLRALQKGGSKITAVTPLAFPPDFADYHDYAEMVSELQTLAATYPDITHLQSIGQSHEGRKLWILRITDRPDETEAGEKGILIYSGTHAREHLSVEQSLFLANDLLQNYGVEGEATNLIDNRDIWILPNLNPDGSEYDINQWHLQPPYWRKNRRDNLDGNWGVDLNRNFGYRWGCCGGSSSYTGSSTYRGPSSFSEPESQALRDFVIAHPHLTVGFTLHTYGELILYPYGYTYSDLPPDMDPDDLRIFRAMSSGIARLNGYHAQQASNLYVVDGEHTDWFYGERHIYALTWELYPTSANPGFYPPAQAISAQTERNRTALRYGISLADDPAKSIGEGADMTPPQIQILTPGQGEEHLAEEPIHVTVAVTDNVGVSTVEYLIDGEPVAVRNAGDFSATLTLAAGSYELTARAFDVAHWQSVSAPLPLEVYSIQTIYLPLWRQASP
jgi:murein tripeptide amidase MpaA